MCHDRKQSHQKISTCHNRYQHRRNKSDSMYSSENDQTGSDCQNQTYNHRITALTVSRNIIFQSRRHIIRLQTIESISKTNDQKHRKKHSHPTFSKRLLHIVGRTAAEVFSILCLIYLCQCTFDKCRSTSDHSHHPHPEYRSRSACRDSSRDSCDISCSDTGCCGNHKRLKR